MPGSDRTEKQMKTAVARERLDGMRAPAAQNPAALPAGIGKAAEMTALTTAAGSLVLGALQSGEAAAEQSKAWMPFGQSTPADHLARETGAGANGTGPGPREVALSPAAGTDRHDPSAGGLPISEKVESKSGEARPATADRMPAAPDERDAKDDPAAKPAERPSGEATSAAALDPPAASQGTTDALVTRIADQISAGVTRIVEDAGHSGLESSAIRDLAADIVDTARSITSDLTAISRASDPGDLAVSINDAVSQSLFAMPDATELAAIADMLESGIETATAVPTIDLAPITVDAPSLAAPAIDSFAAIPATVLGGEAGGTEGLLTSLFYSDGADPAAESAAMAASATELSPAGPAQTFLSEGVSMHSSEMPLADLGFVGQSYVDEAVPGGMTHGTSALHLV